MLNLKVLKMDINELKGFYEKRQNDYKEYLENELRKFKDANNNYLSSLIAEACEQAKNLLENSNKKAFDRFNETQIKIEKMKNENYPETLLVHFIESVKNDLDRSLIFHQSLFDQSIAYYKGLLPN